MKEAVALFLDESLMRQERLLGECNGKYDMQNLGRSMRYWCGRERLESVQLPFEVENKVIFYGSCDFHHMTYRFLREMTEPTTLVIFDRHTECELFFGGHVYCGSWIYDALKLANVERIFVVGVDSDIDTILFTELLNPILVNFFVDFKRLSGKTRILPYVPHNKKFLKKRDCDLMDGIISPPMKDAGEFLDCLLGEIPTERVYVSVDKDVFSPDYSCTNWGSGRMGLDSFGKIFKGLCSNKEIVSVDVCGDASFGGPAGLLRNAWSFFGGLGRRDYGSAVNEETNMRLLEFFRGVR